MHDEKERERTRNTHTHTHIQTHLRRSRDINGCDNYFTLHLGHIKTHIICEIFYSMIFINFFLYKILQNDVEFNYAKVSGNNR